LQGAEAHTSKQLASIQARRRSQQFGQLASARGQNITGEIIGEYEEALRIDPNLTEAAENLRVAKQSDTRFQIAPESNFSEPRNSS